MSLLFMQDYFHKYQNAILIQPKMNEWNGTLMILSGCIYIYSLDNISKLTEFDS
jgi:hypothetical protein